MARGSSLFEQDSAWSDFLKMERGSRRLSTTGSMEVSLVRYPWFSRLKMDSPAIQRKVGQKIATKIRARIKKGSDSKGSLPNTKRDERPILNDTGRLIRSIKYRKKMRDVAPSGTRRDGHKYNKKSRNKNASVFAIQVFTKDIDPLNADEYTGLIEKIAAAEIQKQIDSGKFSLLHEMRTT